MTNQFYDGIHSSSKRVNLADFKVHDRNQEDQFCKTNINDFICTETAYLASLVCS